MASVSRTELNQQTARVLARVVAGERLTVTDRGRPVAELSPIAGTEWDRLVREGRVTPAATRGPLDVTPVVSDVSSAEMIADVRRDRA